MSIFCIFAPWIAPHLLCITSHQTAYNTCVCTGTYTLCIMHITKHFTNNRIDPTAIKKMNLIIRCSAPPTTFHLLCPDKNRRMFHVHGLFPDHNIVLAVVDSRRGRL